MWYQLALFVHVVGAIGLFVAIGITHAGLARLRAARTFDEAHPWSALIAGVGALHPPSTLAILLAGLYLAATAWGWRVAWIDASLALTMALAALGPAVNGHRLAAIGRALGDAPAGPLPAGTRALIHDPVLHTAELTMAALGLGIVFLMTVRPGLVGTLLALAVALVAGLAASAPSWRTADPAREEVAAEPAA